jgi:DNA-directed RNA polymerase subunit RPC12/RpoP
MALDERDFFTNRNETRNDKLTCLRCKRENEYQMRWVVRTKKDRLPPGADERDRAMYAKLRDYMIRVDDAVTCKTCGKKFDIPSQHSMVFIDKGVAASGADVTYAGGDDEDSRFNK